MSRQTKSHRKGENIPQLGYIVAMKWFVPTDIQIIQQQLSMEKEYQTYALIHAYKKHVN